MFKKRKQAKELPKQPTPHSESEAARRIPVGGDREPERQPTPFEEALRQIQDALAEANDEREEKVEPPVAQPPTRRRVQTPYKRPAASAETPAKSRMSLFERADAATKKQPKRVEPKQSTAVEDPYKESFYDEAFESEAPYAETFHETVHSHLKTSDEAPDADTKKRRPPHSKWQKAYVMSEILNAPRSRAPWRNRMTQ